MYICIYYGGKSTYTCSGVYNCACYSHSNAYKSICKISLNIAKSNELKTAFQLENYLSPQFA